MINTKITNQNLESCFGSQTKDIWNSKNWLSTTSLPESENNCFEILEPLFQRKSRRRYFKKAISARIFNVGKIYKFLGEKL